MAGFNISSNKVFQIRLAETGEQVEISEATGDHAVRYPDAIGWLDHLVVYSPIGIPFEDTETGQEGVLEAMIMNRIFLGAKVVEAVVEQTGLLEVYPSEVTEAVHEDYIGQQANGLDAIFGGDGWDELDS